MLKDFKKFIERGNVIELAVAVILGVAFNDVVKSFTNDVLMQVIALLTGGAEPNFDRFVIVVNNVDIRYGAFITALVNFLIIAAATFLIVKAIEKAESIRHKGDDDTEIKITEVELLEEIRDLLAEDRKGRSILGK